MLKHKHADVGVAVSIPGGLITPIIRKAETKTLSAISNEMKDLAARARDRKLKPEEYQGGTTSVSNLGMFGIKDFAAVINPPHCDDPRGRRRRAARRGQERRRSRSRTIMTVTLSSDHRAVDGALGAELLGAFKALHREAGDDAGVRTRLHGSSTVQLRRHHHRLRPRRLCRRHPRRAARPEDRRRRARASRRHLPRTGAASRPRRCCARPRSITTCSTPRTTA